MGKEIIFNVEPRLKEYFPEIFLLLDTNKISWTRINRLFQTSKEERMGEMKSLGIEKKEYQYCFLDVVHYWVQNNKEGFDQMSFFGTLFEALSKCLEKNEKQMMAKTIYNLLTNFDKNYLNFVGEFAILNILILNGCKLLEVEKPIHADNPKGVKADFLVTQFGVKKYVEVVNIHPEGKHLINDEIICKYITGKIESKRKTLENNSEIDVNLAPVVWGDYEKLEKISNCIEKYNLKFESTMDFNALALYKSSGPEIDDIWMFHTLKYLMLDKNKKFKITPPIFKVWDKERGIIS